MLQQDTPPVELKHRKSGHSNSDLFHIYTRPGLLTSNIDGSEGTPVMHMMHDIRAKLQEKLAIVPHDLFSSCLYPYKIQQSNITCHEES